MTMQDLKQRNLEKIQFLKDNGYNVVETWTCDIERQLATEPKMKDFFDNFEISEPLEHRQAFFGGRTNAARLFYHIQPEEKIRYVANTASIQLAIPRLLLRTFNLSVSTLAW
jgi:hypothetical protein